MRQVGDMRMAHKRHHVMLAMGRERDVLDDDDVVIAAHLAKRAREDLAGILPVAGKEFVERLGDAARGVSSSPSRVGSSPAQAMSVRTAASASSRLGRGNGRDPSARAGCLTQASMVRYFVAVSEDA